MDTQGDRQAAVVIHLYKKGIVIGGNQPPGIVIGGVTAQVLLHGVKYIDGEPGVGLIRFEILRQSGVGRGIGAASHGQAGEISQVLIDDIGNQLQVELRSLNRGFALKKRDQLIAEHGQHCGCQ
ncbi:hypothetical protein D3C80_1848210 [compost metagenome]